MSTGLALIPRTSYLAISNAPEAIEALAAIRENMDGEQFRDSDLIRVKNPTGGSLNFEIETPEGAIATPKIEGVIVYRCKQGVLWQSERPGDQRPVLVTDDMKIGRLQCDWAEVPEDVKEGIAASELTEPEIRQDDRFKTMPADQLPRLFWWDGPKAIPYVQFGTSTKGDGRGKRAKEYQVLYVLREKDVFPIKLRLGPTSIRPTRDYIVKMTDIAYTRAITQITLKQEKNKAGDTYSFAQYKRIGILDQEAAEQIRARFTDVLKGQHEAGRVSVEMDVE